MKRFLIALIAGTAVFAVAFAAAATLSVNGGTIQAGSDDSVVCTNSANVDGWGLETDTGLVGYVRLLYYPGCAGNDMFVTITHNGTPVADAKTTLDNTGSTGNLTLTALGAGNTTPTPVLATDITDIHVFIEGPVGNPGP